MREHDTERRTRHRNMEAAFAVYPATSEIIIGVKGRNSEDAEIHGTTQLSQTDDADDYIGVWNINDDGDIPPGRLEDLAVSFSQLYDVTIDSNTEK